MSEMNPATNVHVTPLHKIKPMLTTSQKNFKHVSHPDTILSGVENLGVSRVDLDVPGSRCFLLHDVLTPSECAHYISETEKIGYSDLADLFPTDYRSNDRVLSICECLADKLWRRIEPALTRREVLRVRPIGFGNEGTWKPFRLNECCKFGRYKANDHFSPHIDGPWVPHEDESSVFTVVIYLNSDFKGGSTKFISEEKQDSVLCSVTPETGTALIFNHDSLHEAEPVFIGTKYIIRTEIMYRRVDTEMLPNPGAYESDHSYIKTLTLYQKSWELEKGFTDTYLEAIKLQRQAQRSIPIESTSSDLLFLPYEIFLKILSYLSVRDMCTAMQVSKSWYDVCMDGELWQELYRTKWPVGFQLVRRINCDKSSLKIFDERPFLRDWYGLYKQRTSMTQPQKVVSLDIGSFSFKCAALHRERSTIRTASCESVIAAVPGVHDLHLRRYDYQRYFSGREAKEEYPGETRSVVEKGIVKLCPMLPEIITRLFFDCVVRPKYSPVIIMGRPGLWTDKMKKDISYSFIKRFENPCVGFLSSAVATLCSLNLSTGVVVDVGYGVATCAAVVDGEQRDYLHCDPSEATPTKLADMVHTVAVKTTCGDDEKSTLFQNIVLTGGQAVEMNILQTVLLKFNREYFVRKTDDPTYAAVLGGCSLANVADFSSLFNKIIFPCHSDSLSDDPWEFFEGYRNLVHETYFYTYHLEWYDYLNAGRRNYKKHYGGMIGWLVSRPEYDYLRQWRDSTTEEGLLMSESGSSDETSEAEDDY